MNHARRLIAALFIASMITGCATSGNPQDPFEGFNRTMFEFNDKLDQVALKPAAIVYRDVTPSFVQTGIGNFFQNIGDAWTAVNNLLQLKIEDGLNDIMRVAVNTTFGFGGILDISSEAGLPQHYQDFGSTLGYWGVPSGPYVVLPFLGSSTLRDAAVLPIEVQGDAWNHVNPTRLRVTGSIVRLVDKRAAVLDASNLLEEVSLDRYEFLRDTYMQRRESKVTEGKKGNPGFDQ